MKKIVLSVMFGMFLVSSSNALIWRIGAPQDSWKTAVANGAAATSNPYRPGPATGTTTIEMGDYTGVLVRAKYLRAETLTTDPIINVFCRDENGVWSSLKDSNGSRAITLSDATTDCDDGALYKWTDMTEKIDALGGNAVRVTVSTAGVSSAAGAIVIEIKRY